MKDQIKGKKAPIPARAAATARFFATKTRCRDNLPGVAGARHTWWIYALISFVIWAGLLPAQEQTSPPVQTATGFERQIPDFYKASIPGYTFDTLKAEVLHSDAAVETPEQTTSEPDQNETVKTDTGPGAMDRILGWFEGFSISQGMINALLLVLIVLVFVFYRLRGGTRRRI
ncbi:MAG: hypothetical protein KDK39_05150 [Leptospiraceae bacterium]|nr:hypothetical protein [Leptospiraceae bacterium]